MPHVSKRKLDPQALKKIFRFLLLALTEIKDTREMQFFLSSFLTKTEKLMLVKRLGVAYLLSEKVSEEKISEILCIGRPTVERIRLLLESEGKGYEIALRVLKRSEIFEELKQVFADILEKIGDPYKEIRRRAYGT
jgi:uncharacterized protein YerC